MLLSERGKGLTHAVTRTGSHGNYKEPWTGELYLKLENRCKGITYYVFQAFKNGDLKNSDHQPRFVVEYSDQTWDVCAKVPWER